MRRQRCRLVAAATRNGSHPQLSGWLPNFIASIPIEYFPIGRGWNDESTAPGLPERPIHLLIHFTWEISDINWCEFWLNIRRLEEVALMNQPLQGCQIVRFIYLNGKFQVSIDINSDWWTAPGLTERPNDLFNNFVNGKFQISIDINFDWISADWKRVQWWINSYRAASSSDLFIWMGNFRY